MFLTLLDNKQLVIEVNNFRTFYTSLSLSMPHYHFRRQKVQLVERGSYEKVHISIFPLSTVVVQFEQEFSRDR